MEPVQVPVQQVWLGLQGRTLLPDVFCKSLFLETSNFIFALGLRAVGQGLLILPVQMQQVLRRRGLPAMEEAEAEHLCSLVDLLSPPPGESSNQRRHLSRLPGATKAPKPLTHSANPPPRAEQLQLVAQPESPL